MSSVDFSCPGFNGSAVPVAVVIDRAVIAREDDDCVFGESVFRKRLEHLAGGPIELHHGVAPIAQFRLALETRVRRPRDVDILG